MNVSARCYLNITMLCAISALLSCASMLAQSQQSWRSLDAEYRKAFAEKQYDTALLKATLSVKAAKHEYGDNHFFVAISLNNKSRAYSSLGQKKQSDQDFSSAIDMTRKLLDTDDSEVLAALRNSTPGNPYAKNPYADFKLNTLPWIKWGNTPADPSSPNDRLEMFYNHFLSSLFGVRQEGEK